MVVLVGGKGESGLLRGSHSKLVWDSSHPQRREKNPLWGFLKVLSQIEFYKGHLEVISSSVFSQLGLSLTLFLVMK